ncbi:carboxypeptidase regulatory-like domain-containing protein [Tessaracoccus sp. MC1679]|uniref:carboxypeptidase-like regulatory domain-containing protein n=1 Tax=Tessaracoccus sp. MC1679 TaxID=2760313 RepID=UPI001600D278|nr:carboxypeptidase-like regulatory domain-containing protein [Tessaracoccus sp. MC1679]MBB1515354.1 carboxypeptidase regulatory-like domain-containing protein [Tessaracoccus sp. MC1679]
MLPTPVRAALAATLVSLFALLALPAHAAPSTLKASFAVAGDEVEIAGTLTSEGDPVKRADLVATMDGREMESDRTNNDGEFDMNFDLPDTLAAGQHVVAVVFGGSRGVDPARAETTITVGTPADNNDDDGNNGGGNDGDGNDGGATPKPTPTATQPGATQQPGTDGGGAATQEPAKPAALTLTAQAPGGAVNGSVITITGRLTDANGNGIGSAGISVADAGGQVDESFTVTTSTGAYEALYAIPEAQPAGTLTLTLSFAGTAQLSAAKAQAAIAIEHTVVATATPTPTGSPTPSTSATPTPSASPSPSEDDTTPATTPTDAIGPVSWFLVASVVVGGSALIATAVMVFRGAKASRLGDDEGTSIDFLDDTLSQTETLHGMLGPDPAGEAPPGQRPARAMPEDL